MAKQDRDTSEDMVSEQRVCPKCAVEQTLAAAVVYLLLKTRDTGEYDSHDERVEEAALLRRAADIVGGKPYEDTFELCRQILSAFESKGR